MTRMDVLAYRLTDRLISVYTDDDIRKRICNEQEEYARLLREVEAVADGHTEKGR